MKTLPALGDDARVRLSRQGGFAPIHALSRPREIEFAQCDINQRSRICSVLEGCLPLDSVVSGRSDQRFYQIEVSYRSGEQEDQMVLKVPEDRAPGELVHLWDTGELM
ncbi:protealysin inhibitor emfourin [Pseudomonas sp. PP3]|uniref:protealysin inhibitor emfourin n=1 Tax=Pseudomonas sp. PP3 TaxID=2815936 RepID=UPI001BAF506D|nr:protealysin inhibitor emfourin [Pseudomonas sp. PP3]